MEPHKDNCKTRLDVYNELVDQKGFDKDLRFEIDNCENLIRFMDAVVIKLEGGSNEDIEIIMGEPIFDEAIEEVQKKKSVLDKNGDTGKNGNDSPAENGDVKVEPEDGQAIRDLLKRVPYKTNSIFFRNIPATAKLEEIETECKSFPGFLRLGMSEPLNDQNFSRRLWVSFSRDMNIKEIFWNIKNAKFTEGDAQNSVNRDLRRRVRTVNGISHHRPIVQNDIRQAARLIALYDQKRKLFAEGEQKENAKNLDALVSRSSNPILKGIFEYFVEESNAEEEELLGVTKQAGEDLKFPLEVDKSLIKFLDKLLVYLRVVHSVDYYNHVEYTNEDSMPNRMGMLHVRDFPLSGEEHGKTSSGVPLVQKKAVDSFISNNDERLKSTILKFEAVSENDLNKLGKKDPEQAVEDFIKVNSVELATDKWLCPLSGKKFKGPEFIRKHLYSKHEQKLNDTKSEAIYFNNFIADPDRPHNPEPKPSAIVAQSTPANDEPRRSNYDRPYNGGGYRSSGNWNDRQRFSGGGSRYNNNNGNRFSDHGSDRGRPSDDFGARRDPRQPASYRDLDAPENII